MLIRLRNKQFQVSAGRNTAFWQEVASGAWESDTFAIFDRFLDQQHSYIDIGTWIGPTLLYGCQLARRTYGLEPDPIAFAELEANLEGLLHYLSLEQLRVVEQLRRVGPRRALSPTLPEDLLQVLDRACHTPIFADRRPWSA